MDNQEVKARSKSFSIKGNNHRPRHCQTPPAGSLPSDMAALRLLFLLALLAFLVQVSSDLNMEEDEGPLVSQVRGGNRRLAQELDCGGLCQERCSLHSRPNVCIRACGTCCVRCKCVPPGTSGNRELCGKCYTDMTTHGNKTKCP